jgi:PAS domain S-box-containing protein
MGAERGWRADMESLLAAIVESSQDAIISKTLDGVITSWNAGAVDTYGYTAQEMIGHSITELMPPDRVNELTPILARVRRGQQVDHFQTRRLRKDGTAIDVSVSVSPIRDAAGAVVGAASVARDVTEQVRAEAERQAARARLNAAERLETMGQLAGGIAHDFNNLLAAIIGYAGLATQEAGDPAMRGDVEQILVTAQRAAALTQGMLVFSRREPGQPEKLDLNAVITGLQEMLAVSTGEHIELRLDTAPDLPAVRTDRGRMEQVLLNLAVNARDAMPEGGSLRIATAVVDLAVGDPRLRTGVDPGRFVELAVTDTGAGMSAEVAARIFEPFFTTKPLGHGTGLGLSTVYGIVTGAGGCIDVDSAIGTGTTFRIYLPAAGASAGPPEDAAAGPGTGVTGPAGRGETILVVDDERAVLDVTARILRRSGYATLEANTWEEALSLGSAREIALMLTDSVMPGMSGAVLADRVRQFRPGLRVVHMSGYAGGSLSPRLDSDGEGAYLPKPFTPEMLLAKVRSALDSPPAD